MSNGGGPKGDKWAVFSLDNSSAELLQALNDSAKTAPPTVAFTAHCTDGDFVFVGSYTQQQ